MICNLPCHLLVEMCRSAMLVLLAKQERERVRMREQRREITRTTYPRDIKAVGLMGIVDADKCHIGITLFVHYEPGNNANRRGPVRAG